MQNEEEGYEEEEGQEEDIYSEEGREELKDDEDAITNIDEGFMQGYEEEDKLAECSYCGDILDGSHIIEEEIDGELYRFCSSACARKFEEKKNEEKES